MKRSVIEVGSRHLANDPEYASLLPGYDHTATRLQRWDQRLNLHGEIFAMRALRRRKMTPLIA